jgi:hypothetical protein
MKMLERLEDETTHPQPLPERGGSSSRSRTGFVVLAIRGQQAKRREAFASGLFAKHAAQHALAV